MDLLTARTRATISVPEAGELLGLGRDASFAAAHRGQIPTLQYGRRLRVPCALLLAQLGEPAEHLRAVPDGVLDPESTEDAEAEPASSAAATVHVLVPGARHGQNASQPPG